MSESRLNRRKFLADALFAGGALGAAALAARYLAPGREPPPVIAGDLEPVKCSPTPTPQETPAMDGNMVPVAPGQAILKPPTHGAQHR